MSLGDFVITWVTQQSSRFQGGCTIVVTAASRGKTPTFSHSIHITAALSNFFMIS